MKQKPSYLPKKYKYSARSGNLKAEAVGVVKGEKHFPVLDVYKRQDCRMRRVLPPWL